MLKKQKDWNIDKAKELYSVDRWGSGYFGVNKKGNVSVAPNKKKEIDIYDVAQEALKEGLHFPMLIRFQDLLRQRVQEINQVFSQTIKEAGYQGEYRGVFPIKVNQLREVVEEIVDAGRPYHYGLEVGSKPELFAALATDMDKQSLIICNGYKDESFIQAAMTGLKLSKKIIMVVEKLEELESIVKVSQKMGITPLLGFRLRLSARGEGRWAMSGGEDAKFGLSTSDLIHAMEFLKQRKMEASFQLLHFHVGSQIPNILTIKGAVREAARYYAKIFKMGFPIVYFDVGGGVGVDYDGSRSVSESSTNYTISEYSRDIVYNVAEICDEEKVPHPHLVSESGRSIVAHHSVLIVDVFGMIEKTKSQDKKLPPLLFPEEESHHKLVQDLLDMKKNLNTRNRREHFHDALQIKEDTQKSFDLGILDLKIKAQVETLFWEIVEKIVSGFGEGELPKEMEKFRNSLGDQFLCNFSVFQSLLDHWAVGQLFPVMPIHRLNKPPTHEGTLVDITCDSDGKISKFIGNASDNHLPQPMMKLHGKNKKNYLLGIFLTGAYQDIMGDMHNLFGRVNEAHVFLDDEEDSGFYIEETIANLNIADVLNDVQYDSNILSREIKKQVDKAIKKNFLKPKEGIRLLEDYEKGLTQTTYLKF